MKLPASQEFIPDQPSTIDESGNRKWIYPSEIIGKWQRIRWVTSAFLLAVLYAAPWVQVNGGPLIRLSFLSSSFIMFGSHILIYEFYHFVLLALLLVVTLFAASALIGRVWCGYACPQTIFIEQILGRVDRFFEGPAAKRLADSKRPLTLNRILRKCGKQSVYVLVSVSFAFTFIAIFTGPQLIVSGKSPGTSLALVILTGIAWFNAAYWREQFCHLVCPYARFQGVMQDLATRTIGYDKKRGEPRGRSLKQADLSPGQEGPGDCIDCGLCVRVCPSGIDIRQGATQQECIACAKCVDACDGVMTNLGRQQGLIRYDAIAVFESAEPFRIAPSMVRPRIVAYAVAWLLIATVGISQFLNRAQFHARIFGTPGAKPWFVEGDRIKNLLILKIGNQSEGPDSYVVLAESTAPEQDLKIESPKTFGPINPGQELTMPLLLSISHGSQAKSIAKIKVRSKTTGIEYSIDRPLVGPSS
ncbi:MAG: cytochrome c oxidase accessory protein CcoG [Proteobacteria bacterium]|nr:cytochrome c oxidase accessory protein CcoG [Pseudomonadota bacterium]